MTPNRTPLRSAGPLRVVLFAGCLAAGAAHAQAPREAVLYRLGAIGCSEQEATQATEALGAELAACPYFDALWQLPDSEISGADIMASDDPANAFPALPDGRVLLRLSGAVVLSPEGGRFIQLVARRSSAAPSPTTTPNDPELPAVLGFGLPVPWEPEAPVPVARLLAECARAVGPLARIRATNRSGEDLWADLETWAPLPPGRYAVCEAVGGDGSAALMRTVGVVTLGGADGARRPVIALAGRVRAGLHLALHGVSPLQWPSLAQPMALRSSPSLAAVSFGGRFVGITPCLAAVFPGTRGVEVGYADQAPVVCHLPSTGLGSRSVLLAPGPPLGIGPEPGDPVSLPTGTGPLAMAVNLPLELAPAPPPGPHGKPIPHRELPPGGLWPSYPEPRRVAALTFDDYPSEGLSGNLLTVLRENEVKATFFVIGHKAAKMPYLLRQAVAEGHVLGNHTYDHKRLGDADWAQVHDQITRCSEVVRRITGAGTRYFRPPGGQTSSTLKAVLPSVGMRLVMWDAAAPDYANPPPEEIVSDILANAGGHSRLIINLHDGHLATIQALPELIHQLRLRAYRFVTIDEFLRRR